MISIILFSIHFLDIMEGQEQIPDNQKQEATKHDNILELFKADYEFTRNYLS